MFMAVTLIALITSFAQESTGFDTCVPDTTFQLNERICQCDSNGVWSEADCEIIGRRQYCTPGQIIIEGCTTCVCQANQRLFCSIETCAQQVAPIGEAFTQRLDAVGPFCNKFRSYFVNCSICTCPLSGKSSDALCVPGGNCIKQKIPDFSSFKEHCIPSVMYIFQCAHCVCSDMGFFSREKCIDTCQNPNIPKQICIPNKVYKKRCNVCLCPENGIKDPKNCTKSVCHKRVKLTSLRSNETRKCIPHTFTRSQCMYCTCNQNGTVNTQGCFEQACLEGIDYSVFRDRCTQNEIVPNCKTCICLRNGVLDNNFCTTACSDKNKLNVIESVLKDSRPTLQLINRHVIDLNAATDKCRPNSIYFTHNEYCICPDNGDVDSNICIKPQSKKVLKPLVVDIDFNTPCAPSTFIDFDCNTCFCSKNGTIDPKWCTYDDCETKQAIQKGQARNNAEYTLYKSKSASCTPGIIYKHNCNYCICPENGQANDSTCTTNICKQAISPNVIITFCEPLSYYSIDCNVCYCPLNGKKNLNLCTKYQCESNNVLRTSTYCHEAQLFINNCNICVCPPNGNRAKSVCTNHRCNEENVSWNKIYEISEHLLGDPSKPSRNLDMCCPGEEFPMGCKLCVCPDIGLRMYAVCTNSSCSNREIIKNQDDDYSDSNLSEEGGAISRRAEHCFSFNISSSIEMECDPGSTYIINCQQCICPIEGNIKHFCRPLPKGTYCEKEYFVERIPNRKNLKSSNTTSVKHMHTKYKCAKSGTIMDKCFICECEEAQLVVVEEHCYRNQEDECIDAKPTFLKDFASVLG